MLPEVLQDELSGSALGLPEVLQDELSGSALLLPEVLQDELSGSALVLPEVLQDEVPALEATEGFICHKKLKFKARNRILNTLQKLICYEDPISIQEIIIKSKRVSERLSVCLSVCMLCLGKERLDGFVKIFLEVTGEVQGGV